MSTQSSAGHTQPTSTRAGAPGPSAAAYLPSLDGWRALAIALVLLSHAAESIISALPAGLALDLPALKHLGLSGVQLFFGLSGFLITSKLLEEEQRHGRINLSGFYLRRSFRILPAALVLLAVLGLLSLLGVLDIGLTRWLSTLFFAANYSSAAPNWYVGHFWSLAVEEHFYFLWPAALVLLHRSRRRLALVFALALALAVWRALDFKYQITGAAPVAFWGRTDIQADGILCGVAIALLNADPVWRPRLQRFLTTPATWGLLGALLLALQALNGLNWKLDFLLISVKALLLPLLMLGTVLRSSDWPARLLERAPMRFVGRLSYSLYLWQQLFLVGSVDRVPGLGALQVFPLNLIAVFACAMLSLHLIEQPMIALGQRVAKRIRSGAPSQRLSTASA